MTPVSVLSQQEHICHCFCVCFVFVTMKTEAITDVLRLSLCVDFKWFLLTSFFFLTNSDSQKASPVTNLCSHLFPLSSLSHVASGPKKCIFESLPAVFFSRNDSSSLKQLLPPLTRRHAFGLPLYRRHPCAELQTEPQIMVSHSWSKFCLRNPSCHL